MTWKRSAAWLCDVALLLCTAGFAYLLIVGGGTFFLGSIRLRVTTTRNLVNIAAAVVLIRSTWLADVPLFASRFVPERLSPPIRTLFARPIDHKGAAGGVLALIVAASLGLRLANAILHPGFATGDDVEVHGMSLGALLHTGWPSWNLRSAVYPMVFLYPVQAAAHAMGITDVGLLILAGRLVVVALSTATIVLVYRITRQLAGNEATALVAAILLAASRLHLWFGGSEFPRPVASAFIMAAFLALMVSSPARAVLGGVLLGVGGSLRVGELIFLAPAMLCLIWDRRWRDAVVAAGVGVVTAAVVLGAADYWFWGEPFASVRHLFVYTVVEGRSSRGFQPPLYYVTAVSEWSNVIVVLLALWGARLDKRVAVWLLVPFLMLSLLPHKEPRYLVPVYPFVAIAAALAVRDLCGRARRVPPIAVVGLLTVAIATEVSPWRFIKTDSAVRLARQVRLMAPRTIAAQQVSRFGGPLYWVGIPLVEIPDEAADASLFADTAEVVILVPDSTPASLTRDLESRGFRPFSVAAGEGDYLVFRRPLEPATRLP